MYLLNLYISETVQGVPVCRRAKLKKIYPLSQISHELQRIHANSLSIISSCYKSICKCMLNLSQEKSGESLILELEKYQLLLVKERTEVMKLKNIKEKQHERGGVCVYLYVCVFFFFLRKEKNYKGKRWGHVTTFLKHLCEELSKPCGQLLI